MAALHEIPKRILSLEKISSKCPGTDHIKVLWWQNIASLSSTFVWANVSFNSQSKIFLHRFTWFQTGFHFFPQCFNHYFFVPTLFEQFLRLFSSFNFLPEQVFIKSSFLMFNFHFVSSYETRRCVFYNSSFGKQGQENTSHFIGWQRVCTGVCV